MLKGAGCCVSDLGGSMPGEVEMGGGGTRGGIMGPGRGGDLFLSSLVEWAN